MIKEIFREVTFNQRLPSLCQSGWIDIRVCEGYDPESKGKVEAGSNMSKAIVFTVIVLLTGQVCCGMCNPGWMMSPMCVATVPPGKSRRLSTTNVNDT